MHLGALGRVAPSQRSEQKKIDFACKVHIVLVMFSPASFVSSFDVAALRALAAITEALAALALAMEKASPDDPKHPGWPAGAPNSQGGRFRPKDRDSAGEIVVRPNPPRRASGELRDSALSDAAKSGVLLLIRMGLRAANVEAPGLGLLLEIGLDLAIRAYPYVQAYFDPPKSLEELEQAALVPQPGYDVHHIVEQASAQNAEEKTRIEQPDNKVLIPTLKHWELNGWYERKDVRFGGTSPRDYLEGKSWEERQRVGLIGLRAVGVLK